MNNIKKSFLVLTLILIAGCMASDESDVDGYETGSLSGLAYAKSTNTVFINNSQTYSMAAEKVIKDINGNKFIMYGYNGQIPGPLIKVKQGSSIKINFTNKMDKNTTIHWHGLRHDYKDDGVPGISQDPVKPGENFTYNLKFPDEGIFWYHPHIREDAQQDLGLYGNILVEPLENYYNPVDKEEFLMVDDILVEHNKIVPYGNDNANFALMGRFGNTMLVNGLTNYGLQLAEGEIVRFYITSTSNARPFNLSFEGMQLKLVGGDIGRYESEKMVKSIVIGPAERYIVEVEFNKSGNYRMINTNLWKSYTLGKVMVSKKQLDEKRENFQTLRDYEDVKKDIEEFKKYFDRPIDEEINLGIELNHAAQEMHSLENIEWEDTMIDINRDVYSDEITWFIEDKKTKKRNMDINYTFKKGSIKKIKFVNSKHSEHPMQHLIHLHGQRFLILEIDDERNNDLVWKDTFFIPTGSSFTILMDNSNPGIWMVHCHIAEHLEAGMMASFKVE